MSLGTFQFLGLPLRVGSPDDAADWLIEQATTKLGMPTIVEHINVYNYFLIHRVPGLECALADRSVLLLEGIGMKMGALLHAGLWLPDLNGTDLFPLVADRARCSHLPMYFLGGTSYTVRAAAKECIAQFPGLELVGYEGGFFANADEPNVVHRVNRSGAQLLLVGRGAPLQDEFALRWRSELDVGVVWAVGGLFDILSGTKPRASSAIRSLRLEWLYRFAREPRRMWFRNVPVPVWFAGRIVSQRWAKGRLS